MLLHGVPHASGQYRATVSVVALVKSIPGTTGQYRVTGSAVVLVKGSGGTKPPLREEIVLGDPGVYAVTRGSGFLTHAKPFRRTP